MNISPFVRIMAWIALIAIGLIVLVAINIAALLVPISDGQDIGHLATVGILRDVA